MLSCIGNGRLCPTKGDAKVLTCCATHYEYPGQCAHAPVLPGVLLLFSSDEVLIHVSATGNLREELSTKAPRHNRTAHFAAEIIFDHQQRAARAAELAQFLTPPSKRMPRK
jgi:hypothetical protein